MSKKNRVSSRNKNGGCLKYFALAIIILIAILFIFDFGSNNEESSNSINTNNSNSLPINHGDNEVSFSEKDFISESFAKYTETLDEVYIDEYEIIEISESPHERIDNNNNTYNNIYIVEIGFKLDGDSARHSSRATIAFQTNEHDEVTVLSYDSSLNNKTIYIETEFK